MSISPRFLDQLRSRLTLSDVIGKRIKVMRSGREYKACCPFHKEKTPSFTINDDKQFYHCFGCGAHGDVIKFVMEHDNMSFMDTVEILSAQAGLTVPKQSPAEVKKAKEDKSLYDLLAETSQWFEAQIYDPRNEGALKYMRDRGLSDNIMRKFQVGYAPSNCEPLRQMLLQKGYKDAQMIEAGVMRAAKEGHSNQNPYGFFRERIMFPVSDKRGRIVAFGGRILPEHLRPPSRGDFKPPKYINSSDTPVFNKSWTLYGQQHARKAAANDEHILVVEGYLDVIACHQAGFEGAVAPMGTALTEEQIISLWKMIPYTPKMPVLCFDGDNAGQRAAQRACERIMPMLKADQSVRFAFLPKDEDPDTLIRGSGKNAFRKVIESATPLFEYVWLSHITGRDLKTPEAKAGLTKAIDETVRTIADGDVQRYYRQQMKDRISSYFFNKRQSNWNNNSHNKGQGGYGRGLGLNNLLKPKRPIMRQRQNFYKVLVAAVLNHPEIFERIEDEFCSFDVLEQRINALRQEIVTVLCEEPDLESKSLQARLHENGFKKEIGDILNESVYVHASFCAPASDSSGVAKKWIDFYKDVQDISLSKEIKTGWRDAFETSNQEDEDRVMSLVQARLSQVDRKN